jgi:hypothetical protein
MAFKSSDSCHAKALDDEPLFTLLARDPHAPALVRAWAAKRQFEIDNGMRPVEDQPQVDEAMQCAQQMTEWRAANDGKWREPK